MQYGLIQAENLGNILTNFVDMKTLLKFQNFEFDLLT